MQQDLVPLTTLSKSSEEPQPEPGSEPPSSHIVQTQLKTNKSLFYDSLLFTQLSREPKMQNATKIIEQTQSWKQFKFGIFFFILSLAVFFFGATLSHFNALLSPCAFHASRCPFLPPTSSFLYSAFQLPICCVSSSCRVFAILHKMGFFFLTWFRFVHDFAQT